MTKISKNPPLIILILLLLGLSLLAVRDLLSSGYYESHDGIIHVMRLAHFDQALKAGQFPVRWLPTWMAGYGSPVFNFNWSLPYYLGVGLHQLGLSYQTAIKTLFIASLVLSGLTCFAFIYQLLDDKWAALAASSLYIWAPYRFTVIFIRGALGEALSFIFFPLILLSVSQAGKKDKYPVWTVWVWVAFILTHNIMSLIAAGLFFAFAALLSIELKNKQKFLISTFRVFVKSLAISTFFWLPALVESKLIFYINTQLYDYSQQFISLVHLLFSQWQYGVAIPALPQQSMSFQIGWVHVLVVVLALHMLISSFNKKKPIDRYSRYAIFFLCLFAMSIFLTNKASKFIYDIKLVSSVINFPWRWLEIATLSASWLAAFLVLWSGKKKPWVALGLIILAIFLYWPNSHIVSSRFSGSDAQYKSMLTFRPDFLPDTEFLPIDTSSQQYWQLLKDQGLATDQDFLTYCDGHKLKDMKYTKINLLDHEANISIKEKAEVCAHQFYFPGWQIWVDNQLVKAYPDQYGLIRFNLDQGTHRVRAKFANTWTRTLANSISLLSISGIVVKYLFNWLWVKRKTFI